MEKKKKLNGEIGTLEEAFDGATCTKYWIANVWFYERPDLKLGACKVEQ